MKEARPAFVRFSLPIALILGSSAFQAQAYYHPEEGRWISRDPIGERAFILRLPAAKRKTALAREKLASQNIYLAFANAPAILVDYLGLFNVSGNCAPFSTEQVRSQLQIAYTTYIAGIREPLQQSIRDNWDNMTFTCRDNAHKDCKEQKDEHSFVTRRGLANVGVIRDVNVTVTYHLDNGSDVTASSLNRKRWYTEVTICPCNMGTSREQTGKTGFHEAAHAVGWGGPFKDDENASFDNLPPNQHAHPPKWGVPGEGSD